MNHEIINMNELLQSILQHDLDPLFAKEFFHTPEKAKQFCQWLQCYIQTSLNLTKNMDIIALTRLAKEVVLGYDVMNEILVARKKIEFKDSEWCIPLHAIYELHSLFQLSNLHSEHLQQLVGIHMEPDYMYIVSQHVPLSFHSLFRRCNDPLPWEFVLLKVYELIHVVSLLHSNQLAHRDIKSDNICFNSCGKLVLLDFDCASIGEIRPTFPICTLTTRPPELIEFQLNGSKNNVYNAFALDWWSVACVIAEMFLCEPLFPQDNEHTLLEAIYDIRAQLNSTSGCKLLKRKMPCNVYSFIKDILTCEPEQRCLCKLVE